MDVIFTIVAAGRTRSRFWNVRPPTYPGNGSPRRPSIAFERFPGSRRDGVSNVLACGRGPGANGSTLSDECLVGNGCECGGRRLLQGAVWFTGDGDSQVQHDARRAKAEDL